MAILAPVPTSVYRYYDAFDFLIYVGITSRADARQREHNGDKEWWRFVARQEVEHHPSREAALARERELIQSQQPPFNRQHNPVASEMREAYLLFRAAHSQPGSLKEAVRELEGRLPLTVHTLGGPWLQFRTQLDHTPIAFALIVPNGKAKVYGFPNKKPLISSGHRVGPLLVLRTPTTSWHPVEDAYASIAFKEGGLTLRNVHVKLDHSDRDACGPRCGYRQRMGF